MYTLYGKSVRIDTKVYACRRDTCGGEQRGDGAGEEMDPVVFGIIRKHWYKPLHFKKSCDGGCFVSGHGKVATSSGASPSDTATANDYMGRKRCKEEGGSKKRAEVPMGTKQRIVSREKLNDIEWRPTQPQFWFLCHWLCDFSCYCARTACIACMGMDDHVL